MEALCFGARNIVERFAANGPPIRRAVMASGITEKNPLLLQIMPDVLNRTVEVPDMPQAAAVGVTIHAAVAAGLVEDFSAATQRYGARRFRVFEPDPQAAAVYDSLFQRYRAMSEDAPLLQTIRELKAQRL